MGESDKLIGSVRIAIDRGGTFTDVHAYFPGSSRPDIVLKLLSVDPRNYKDAPTEGIRRVLEIARNTSLPKEELISLDDVESIRMGTTVATNALLERQGERSAFLTTRGFRDILVIGNQARPHIFDLSVAKLKDLYEKVVEIDERVTLEGYSEDPMPMKILVDADPNLVSSVSGEVVRILKRPDMEVVRSQLQELKDDGFKSIAICFIHSYLYPDHEIAVADEARKLGMQVSVSSTLHQSIKMVPRANSATADAYLSPITTRYIESFGNGFTGGLDAFGNKLLLMQSDGGLCPWSQFSGLRAILSGPAGGVVGYAKACFDEKEKIPILGFDMGGTSTDVSRFSGSYNHVFETETAEVTIQTPQLDIVTVAAGGGSILFWRNGLFAIGPESAGAHPGPTCYRKGGPLTVTDANLFLGRLLPHHFPSIFGPNEDQPLDVDATRTEFLRLTAEINASSNSSMTPEDVACGFLRVANEGMSRPIRSITEGKGLETSAHCLATFGGAGGQHACAVADSLGISSVVIHRYSSILSAYGMSLADVTYEALRPSAVVLSEENMAKLASGLEELKQETSAELANQGFKDELIDHVSYLNLRYKGSNTALMIPSPDNGKFADAFHEAHKREFTFAMNKEILVDSLRVRGIGKSLGTNITSPFEDLKKVNKTSPPKARDTARVFSDSLGWTEIDVYQLGELSPGNCIHGPAMIIDQTQTIYIEQQWFVTALNNHLFLQKKALEFKNEQPLQHDKEVNPIQLSVFGHRFMSIAEQMGNTLQKTSVSVNIKERLDFSCAIFSPDGGLVANAPHIPIHLGSMSYAVAYQAQKWGNTLTPDDVLVSNHPIAGGSHLPDITVITPVISKDTNEVLFWTASRGHHADIGGISAGSMPPHSKEIWQEGASFTSFKLVSKGNFDEDGLRDIMITQPSKYEGCSGTRTWSDNVSDLKAQIAANSKGVNLVYDLIEEYGLAKVQQYMQAIQDNAEQTVRQLLRVVYDRFHGLPLEAVDYMDDGTALKLKIVIDKEEGKAVFDFTGTGKEVYGNLNAPKAITFSAIIYVLRSLIKQDIPLNQGCLAPIDVVLPEGTLLSPSAGAATVGGNVETSQRVTDLILRAFQASGASQGTCNNLTFGFGGHTVDGVAQPGFGYYETIAGGAGAGPDWEGQSGVHVHMTNTRITDPETLEKRYPCILHEFAIRRGSGGKGLHCGGDGCIRDIEFTIPLEVSILSERRVVAPYGMCGGEAGSVGQNIWVRENEKRKLSLGGKNSCKMAKGDRIVIYTPGGGAYGAIEV
ncbi:Hydantoinase B/oxoprolinase domain containing protein [Hyaloscypha variabilis]